MLLRHAKTERAGRGGDHDLSRKLTKRGRADIFAMGAYMVRYGLEPDFVIVSPAARAMETWTILADCLAKAPRPLSDDRIYNATLATLISVIRETRSAHELLVVGHNPSLHDLASRLIASGDADTRQRLKENLPTSGLVSIDLPFDDWSLLHQHSGRLERFVSPRLIVPTKTD
jgi:phosphohistidine phosphatase